MDTRKILPVNAIHRMRYESAVQALRVSIVIELAAVLALLVSIITSLTESPLALMIPATVGGYAIVVVIGLAVIRRPSTPHHGERVDRRQRVGKASLG